MNYNKIILGGHLTKDIEKNFTQAGVAYAKSGIAVNSGYGDKKTVMFIDFVAWNKTADFLEKHFKKGSAILIEGELKLDTWEDKNGGGKKSKHTLNVSNVTFAGGEGKQNNEATQTESKTTEDTDGPIPF